MNSLLVAGSQGQASSALSRIANNAHKYIKIKPNDVIVFSSDPIPGNENAVYTLIDMLTKQGARVSYSDVLDKLHVSGHASQSDIMLMMGLTKAKYLLPIGGTYRHMKQFSLLAQTVGYDKNQVLSVDDGQIVEFNEKGEVQRGKKIEIKNILVDGLGVGDVGNVVLRDRKVLSQEGVVIIIVSIEADSGRLAGKPDLISRGFVYTLESENLFNEAKKVVAGCLGKQPGKIIDWQYVRHHIQDALEEFFYKETKRRPMILTVIVEV